MVLDKEGIQEIASRYNINLDKLEKEQMKLAKLLSIKDSINFKDIERVAGIENVFFRNKIISAVVVLDSGEITEQEYFEDRISFPYIPGFRAYRELPNMINAFNKIDVKPELVFVRGHGILHPRLGIASHFSISSGVPSIGIADSLVVGEIRGEDIFLDEKIKGKVLAMKEGANPVYVSPGDKISVNSAFELARKYVIEPHKIPEPLRLARRYAKEVAKTLFNSD